jgi:hypothetical protein
MKETENSFDNKIDQSEYKHAFHIWKHENKITALLFEYLKDEINDATTRLVTNGMSDISPHLEMKENHILCAKIQFYTELLNLYVNDNNKLQVGSP